MVIAIHYREKQRQDRACVSAVPDYGAGRTPGLRSRPTPQRRRSHQPISAGRAGQSGNTWGFLWDKFASPSRRVAAGPRPAPASTSCCSRRPPGAGRLPATAATSRPMTKALILVRSSPGPAPPTAAGVGTGQGPARNVRVRRHRAGLWRSTRRGHRPAEATAWRRRGDGRAATPSPISGLTAVCVCTTATDQPTPPDRVHELGGSMNDPPLTRRDRSVAG